MIRLSVALKPWSSASDDLRSRRTSDSQNMQTSNRSHFTLGVQGCYGVTTALYLYYQIYYVSVTTEHAAVRYVQVNSDRTCIKLIRQ